MKIYIELSLIEDIIKICEMPGYLRNQSLRSAKEKINNLVENSNAVLHVSDKNDHLTRCMDSKHIDTQIRNMDYLYQLQAPHHAVKIISNNV